MQRKDQNTAVTNGFGPNQRLYTVACPPSSTERLINQLICVLCLPETTV